jgi:hypothetical protein
VSSAVPHSITPHSSSFYRASKSLSAATSSTAKRAIARTSPRGSPSPTSSRLAFPASARTKLVPKRTSGVEAPEIIISAEPESSVSLHRSETDSMTPRRRLQALFSSESSPSLGEAAPTQNGLNGHEQSDAQRARSLRIPYFKGSSQDNARDQETKRTTLTSKLDSIILTSKLFPLPSARAKAPLTPVSPDQRAPTSHTAIIPLAHAASSPNSHIGTVFLDSPPSKNVKVQQPRKGHILLSQSLGLEENRPSSLNSKNADQNVAPKRPGRVSFSERLFSPSTDRNDEPEADLETTKGMWGSWSGRRGRPPTLSFIKEKSTSSPPSTPRSAFSSRFSKPQGEPAGDLSVQRRGMRASLTPGCLKTLVSGSNDRNKAPVERDRPVLLRRTRSETHRSGPESRSYSSHRSAPTSRRPEDVEQVVKSKDDKKRITPSRVGSPMPKGRLPEFQGEAELERTSSVKSAGKLDHRGRGYSVELTRRRTIHPMFSFERPGSTEAASMSSSRRGEKADDEETSEERRRAANKLQRVPRKAASPASEPAKLPRHESDTSQSQATHTQDHSYASGNTGGTALTRPEPGVVTRIPMMRTRLGMQSHGTFAFEPAAAVVCSPRSAPSVGTDHMRGVNPTGGSLSKRKGAGLVRSLSVSVGQTPGQVGAFKQGGRAANTKTKELEYIDFYNELKVVLGDGEDWSSFKKCESGDLTYNLIPVSSSM